MLKICSKCGQSKEATSEFFTVDSRVKCGLTAACRKCRAATQKKYNKTPAGKQSKIKHSKTDKCKKAQKAWAQTDKAKEGMRNYNNSEAGRARQIKFDTSEHGKELHRAFENKPETKLRHKLYRQTHKAQGAASTAMYRSAKLQATPAWANLDLIDSIYAECERLSATGVPHEVDHIFPLQSKIVCGLHVESNLQILTREENRRKSNKVRR